MRPSKPRDSSSAKGFRPSSAFAADFAHSSRHIARLQRAAIISLTTFVCRHRSSATNSCKSPIASRTSQRGPNSCLQNRPTLELSAFAYSSSTNGLIIARARCRRHAAWRALLGPPRRMRRQSAALQLSPPSAQRAPAPRLQPTPAPCAKSGCCLVPLQHAAQPYRIQAKVRAVSTFARGRQPAMRRSL